MEQLYKDFEVNDYNIAFVKEKLQIKTRKEATKYRKKLNSIERTNTELKIDFDIFIHFGIPEDWHLFREEMNDYQKMLVLDLAAMKSEL
jgi:transketolase